MTVAGACLSHTHHHHHHPCCCHNDFMDEEEESVVVVDAVPFGDDELMMMDQDDDGIDDEHDDLPIIDLTPTAELVHNHHLFHNHYTTETTMTHAIFFDENDDNSISRSNNSNNTMAVAAVAEVVSFSLRDAHLEGGCGCSLCLGHTTRAQFISATFYKDTKKTSLGFTLLRRESKISSIYEDGLASGSPLREGDRITSVNNKDCSSMSSSAICKLLKSLVGAVTIVVENPDGSPHVVESMVTKANPSELCGVGLKGRPGHRLFISSVDADKLTADSLLNVGDQLLSINGISCHDMEAAEAASIIRQTPKYVTIVAKTRPQTGVVLAEISTHKDTMNLHKISLSSGRKKAHSILRRRISHYTKAAWPQPSSRRSRESSPTTTTTTTTRPVTSSSTTTTTTSRGRSSSQRGRRTTRNARAVQRCCSQQETFLHNLTTSYDWEVDV